MITKEQAQKLRELIRLKSDGERACMDRGPIENSLRSVFKTDHELEQFIDGLNKFIDDIDNKKKMNKQILVNGVLVPAPESEAPAIGTEYYFVHTSGSGTKILRERWEDERWDHKFLSHGNVYLRAEDAALRVKAMLRYEAVG